MLPGSKALVNDLLIFLHKPRYPKLPLSYTTCYCRPQNPVLSSFCLLILSEWCLALAITCKKHCKFSTL